MALLLVFCMLGVLTACGGNNAQEATDVSPDVQTPEAEAPEESSGETQAGEKPKIGFIIPSLENSAQAYAWTQFQKFTPDYGFEVSVFEEGYDAQNGVSAIGTCISQGYAAICMNPTDASALIPAIMEAKEAGIIICLYSAELPEGYATTEYRDFMCGTNDVLFGQVAAQQLMEHFPDGCSIVEVGGQSGHAAQINRHDGFMSEIEGRNVTVLDSKDCDEWASEDAMAIMEDFMVKYGDSIDAVFCHWDIGLSGCIEAIKAAGVDPSTLYLMGADGSSIGFDQVKEGTQALSIGQSFTQMTLDAFDNITTLLEGGTLEKDVIWTEPQIITADTIDSYPYPEW